MIQKFTLIFALCINFVSYSNAQTVKAGLGKNPSYPNSIEIWLQSDLTTPQDTGVSTLQFCIALPDTFSGTPPTGFTIDSSQWVATWSVGMPYTEAGFICYPIFTATSPLYVNYTAMVDEFALRISPIGGTAVPTDYYLVCLPDGGTVGDALFYHFGAWLSDGSQLFYSKSNTTVNNGLSYDLAGGSAGTATSWVKLNASAPLAIGDNYVLHAYWLNDDAFLDWSMHANIEENINFELQKSYDGKQFVGIENLKQLNTVDKGARLNSNTKTYYRIKVIENNSFKKYSNTVLLHNNNSIAVTKIFPNPTSDYINILNSDIGARMLVQNMEGQILLENKSDQNNTKLDIRHLACGNYTIKIINKNNSVTVHKFTKN